MSQEWMEDPVILKVDSYNFVDPYLISLSLSISNYKHSLKPTMRIAKRTVLEMYTGIGDNGLEIKCQCPPTLRPPVRGICHLGVPVLATNSPHLFWLLFVS